MLAARIHEDGGPEVLRVEEVPDPVAGPGQVLVRIRAASLNHLDVWVRKGLPSVPKPRILGADGAGVVEALGEGVSGPPIGTRVVINPGLEHGDRITVVGEHFDGTHARADRDRRRAGVPPRRRAVVRGGRRLPARLRDGLPDARDAGRGPRRASGRSSGASAAASRPPHSRSAERSARGRSSPRAATRSSRPRASGARTSRSTTPRATSLRRSRRRPARASTSSSRPSARRPGPGRSPRPARGPRRRVRRHVGSQSARAAPPVLVEAARRPRLDDGHARGLPRRLRPRPLRARTRARRPDVPLTEIAAAHERLEAGEQLGKIVLALPHVRTRADVRPGAHASRV